MTKAFRAAIRSRLRYNFIMEQMDAYAIIPRGRKRPMGQALKDAVEKIVTKLNPEKIILFGSYAQGSPTPDSDVDLLIIMETNLSQKERSWQVSSILLPRPFPMDILVKTPQEVNQALNSQDMFVREIFSRGIVLYERSQ